MQFELPEEYQDEWYIRECVEEPWPGMALYYAPDGTIHTVQAVAQYTVYLRELSDRTEWTTSVSDIEDNLYGDWFPVEVRA